MKDSEQITREITESWSSNKEATIKRIEDDLSSSDNIEKYYLAFNNNVKAHLSRMIAASGGARTEELQALLLLLTLKEKECYKNVLADDVVESYFRIRSSIANIKRGIPVAHDLMLETPAFIEKLHKMTSEYELRDGKRNLEALILDSMIKKLDINIQNLNRKAIEESAAGGIGQNTQIGIGVGQLADIYRQANLNRTEVKSDSIPAAPPRSRSPSR